MEIILNKNLKENSKMARKPLWYFECQKFNCRCGTVLSWQFIFEENHFSGRIIFQTETAQKEAGNRWREKIGKIRGSVRKWKVKGFSPEAHIFDDKQGKQTESQSVTSVQPEKGAVRTEKQGHPDYWSILPAFFTGIVSKTLNLAFQARG